MASQVQTRTRPVTRDKLARLLGNQELVRLVENLTQDVGTTLPANIGSITGVADAARATATSTQNNLNLHITDAVDAHDASAISNAPAGSITSTNVQDALNELDAAISAFGSMATQNADAVAVTGGTVLLKTGALGYAAGNGGTVVQATDKSTGVTLDKVSGEITLNAASLAAGAAIAFTLTNSTIEPGDRIVLNHKAGGTFMSYVVDAQPGAGSALIGVRNVTTGALAEAIVIGFTVIKSAAS